MCSSNSSGLSLNPKSLLVEQTVHRRRSPDAVLGEIRNLIAHPQDLHKVAKLMEI